MAKTTDPDKDDPSKRKPGRFPELKGHDNHFLLQERLNSMSETVYEVEQFVADGDMVVVFQTSRKAVCVATDKSTAEEIAGMLTAYMRE